MSATADSASSPSPSPWRGLALDQTPAALRVDRGGSRAFGFKRIKVDALLAFANKNNSRVEVRAPYLTMTKIQESDWDKEQMSLADGSQGWNNDSDSGSEDDTFIPRKISNIILKKLKGLSKTRFRLCVHIFRAISDLPQHKITFRSFCPMRDRAPMSLMFQLHNVALTHSMLHNINLLPGIKQSIITLNNGTICTLKIVIR